MSFLFLWLGLNFSNSRVSLSIRLIILVVCAQRALSEALCRSAAGMGSGDATNQ